MKLLLSSLLFSLTSLAVSAQTYTSTGSVTVIPGGGCPGIGDGAASNINVTASGVITTPSEVTIKMGLNANCRATVFIVLHAPGGDTCILINRVDRVGACSGICATYVPTDTLAFNSTYTTPIPTGGGVAAGNYAPTGSTFYPTVGDLSTFLSGRSVNGTWSLVGYSDAGRTLDISGWNISFGATALPLSLIRFNGSNTGQGDNVLTWATATEKNTQSFDIEKSTDGRSYKRIGSLNAVGTGNNNYSYTDKYPESNNTLYRLKMIDKDQSFAYSNVIKLASQNAPAGISVSPNPATDQIKFTFKNLGALTNTTAAVYDQTGRKVYSFQVTESTQMINIAALAAGVYICKFDNGEVISFSKIN